MNIEICPICGIKKLGDRLYWSHTNTVATNDAVYSRVCAIAKSKQRDMSQCINPSDGYNEAKGWQELPKDMEIK